MNWAILLAGMGILGGFAVAVILVNALRKLLSNLNQLVPKAADASRLAELEHRVDLLPSRWEEIVKQAKRMEERNRALVRSARKELAEAGLSDERLDAAAAELQRGDEDGSGEPELFPVRQGMVPSAPARPKPYDSEAATIAAKWGR